jgi:hypothetical protein
MKSLVKRVDLTVALATGNDHISALVIIQYRPGSNFFRGSITAGTEIIVI